MFLKVENRQPLGSMNKAKIKFFEKFNRSNKHLVRLIKGKGGRTQNTDIMNEREVTTKNLIEVKIL